MRALRSKVSDFAWFACLAPLALLAILRSVSPQVNYEEDPVVVVQVASWESSTSSVTSTFDDRLRSAFLLRALGDPKAGSQRDAESVREELQQHFDAICDLLERNAAESLQTALDLLESKAHTPWTAEERKEWHRHLAAQRQENIALLKAYRDRGLFPLNEGHADHPVPIFVDDHDTACAVGHLMRRSGWQSEVESIAATDLLVYVTDALKGPIVDWVLMSGLTQLEAAIIQPAYAPPISTTPMSTLSGTGASVTADAGWFDGSSVQSTPNGLVFENFLWGELAPIENSNFSSWKFHTPNTPLTNPDPQYFGVRTDFGGISGRFDENCPGCESSYGPEWPYANILTVSPGADSYSVVSTFGSDMRYFWFSFDIVAPDPFLAIDRVGVWFAPGFNLGTIEAQTLAVTPSTQVFSDMTIYQPGDTPELLAIPFDGAPLGSLSIDNFFGGSGVPNYEDSVNIAPRDRVTVHTLISVGGESVFRFGADLGGLSHTVRLIAVPEPASIAAIVGGLLCFVGLFRCGRF